MTRMLIVIMITTERESIMLLIAAEPLTNPVTTAYRFDKLFSSTANSAF